MKHATPSALHRFNMDLRLVAAVQANAGAGCHEAANLLHGYSYCAELHWLATDNQDLDEARSSRALLDELESKLRRFLSRCRRVPGGARASTEDRYCCSADN